MAAGADASRLDRVKLVRGAAWVTSAPHSKSRFPHGTCFRRVLLGHSSALSVAYFHPSRALLARQFRDSFLHNIGLSAVIKAPASKGADQQTWRQRVMLCLPQNVSLFVLSSRFLQVVLYQKSRGVMGSVWPEVCSYATDIKLLLPSADVLCIAPHLMDLEQQLLAVASGNRRLRRSRAAPGLPQLCPPPPTAATVHILSHGGLSYALMFSRDHSSVRICHSPTHPPPTPAPGASHQRPHFT
jgi:hypothetical protein